MLDQHLKCIFAAFCFTGTQGSVHRFNEHLYLFRLSSASSQQKQCWRDVGEVGGSLWRRSPSSRLSLTASRPACRIPERLFCSPTVICLNSHGLTSFPEKQVGVWASRGAQGWPGIHLAGSRPWHDKCTLSLEQLRCLNLNSSTVLPCLSNRFKFFNRTKQKIKKNPT